MEQKKGQIKVIGQIILVLTVVLIIIFLLSYWFGYLSQTLSSKQLTINLDNCRLEKQLNPDVADSDKDGLPDTCDPCVDISEDFLLTPDSAGKPPIAFASLTKEIKWRNILGKQISIHSGYSYADAEEKRPDNDGDGLHDACEWTAEMKWAAKHPLRLSIKTSPIAIEGEKLKQVKDPKSDPGHADCKLWYRGGTGCCSRPQEGSKKITAIKSDGTAGDTLAYDCVAYLDKPK